MVVSAPTGVPSGGLTLVTTHCPAWLAGSFITSCPSGAMTDNVKHAEALLASVRSAPTSPAGTGCGQFNPVQPLAGSGGPAGIVVSGMAAAGEEVPCEG